MAGGMVVRRLAVCLLLALIHTIALSPAALAEAVRVGTFNCEFLVYRKIHVKYGLPFDERDWTDEQRQTWSQPGYRQARFRESVQAVATAIGRINADVLVLTEVGRGQDVTALWDEVQRQGGRYTHRVEANSTDTATGQSVAVFSRYPLSNLSSTITGREGYDTELDDPETEQDTGVSKGLSVSVQLARHSVRLFACHLSSERGGHEQDAQRIAQASIVRRNYLPLLNEGEHIIVAGDLNDHRGQPALRRIRGKDDIWDDLVQTGLAQFFPRDKLDTRYTYVFQGERQQLDHVLLSRSLVQLCGPGGVRAETVATETRIGQTDLLASDHRAFVVTLQLP